MVVALRIQTKATCKLGEEEGRVIRSVHRDI